MGTKSLNKKKDWVPGKDMPEFSGKSWKELNDIWPADVRVMSDAWKIISVTYPAFITTQYFMKTVLNGETIGFRDFWILCWLLRCEEAKSNTALTAWPAMKGMNIGGTLWYNRKARITQLGLIENMPVNRVKLYRVTGKGKIIIKYFVDQVEMAHKNLKYWVNDQPKEYADKITHYLNRFWPGWNEMDI